jgi:hypothetical protein
LPKLRRRTPGLRREEVAALAWIGADWYLRLEQGPPARADPHRSSTSVSRLVSVERGAG